ncbi:TetR/AcrR family transcriptional regulator [Lactococcus taiwanensis]|uniref:TetR/AcrR family transcriptional regulator n=1 Tax=Lactococcus taiwanensis TaxID=1151742 RepID=UPI0019039DCF|nr:TetR/AcrR family transcriptional regulator [Lactococcus taiwanensis]
MAATNYSQIAKNDTKNFITTATLQLLGIRKTTEKPKRVDQLTISSVCKRAGVSRMAFYRNYDSIDEVIYQYYQPKIAKSFEIIRQDVSAKSKIENQLKFFEGFKMDLFLSEDQGYEPIIRQIYIEEIENFYKDTNDEYFITFVATGVYAVWRRWLMNGQDKPIEEIHELIRKIVTI